MPLLEGFGGTEERKGSSGAGPREGVPGLKNTYAAQIAVGRTS